MNLFDLYARIFLDTGDYEDKTKQITKEAGGLGGKIGKAFGTATKIIGAGVAVAATGVAALTKNAVDNFAEYEQLVGGAELMFGDAYDYVAEKAKNAYATVQMSQNEYLQQVNGFATGLKTALGGNEKAAADLADRILTAEADVVAATGNTQEAVQNAFNGIMKSNFTMLDNLQLGIKPTKEGFQELIDKVNDWNATNGKATHYQIGNLADMQSALVDYIEMQGLAGYAANEAMDTISGSATATKAAWQNLVTGLADNNADLGALIDNVVQSAGTMFKNIIPVATRALQGIGQAIKSIAPIIARELPGLVRDVLPPLLSAATDIVNALVESLPAIAQVLVDMAPSIINSIIDTVIGLLPQIIDLGIQLILALAKGLSENLPTLIPSVIDMILQIQETLIDNLDMLVDAAIQIAIALAEGLIDAAPILIQRIPELINKLVDAIVRNVDKMVEAGITLFVSLVKNLPAIIAGIVKAIPQILGAIFRALSGVGRSLSKIFTAAWEGIKDVFSGAGSWFKDKFENAKQSAAEAWSGIKDKFSDTWERTKDIYSSAGVWFSEKFSNAKESVSEVWSGVKDYFSESWEQTKEVYSVAGEWFGDKFSDAKEKASNAWDGVRSKMATTWENVKAIYSNANGWFEEKFTSAKDKATDAWDDIKSRFAEKWSNIKSAFQETVSWFSEKFTSAKNATVSAWDNIKSRFSTIWSNIKSGFRIGDALQWGKDMIQNFINGITAKFNALRDKVKSVASTVKSFLGFSVPETGPLSDADTYMPDFMDLMASGIKKYQGKVFEAAETLAEGIETHATPDFSIRGVSNYSTGNDSRILAALGIYFPELIDVIRNMRLYLDGKTLVGGIIDDTDAALGIRSVYATRAN